MKNLLFLMLINFPLALFAQIIEKPKGEENHIFEKIENEAGFPGGTVKWNEFVKKNFNFTRIESSMPDSVTAFSDTAKVQFVVDKNGIIKDIKFLTKNIASFQQSCTDIFKNSPHWTPANQCGRNVNAYRKQTFIVNIDRATGKKSITIRS
jgi:protein TonB